MICGNERFARFVAAFLALAAGCALMLIAPPLADAGIATTKHNLSVSGPGTRKAAGESEICVFCHAPHNASPSGQLWNRRLPTSSYTPYTSSTLKGSPGQPNGASLLCLSCHDGTIALGEVLSRAATIPMLGGTLSGDTLLGTSLSDDHPVSFRFDAALRAARGELVDPSTLVKPSKVRLDANGQLQCTACHDAHDNTNSKFLVVSNAASALCQTCHLKNYWSSSKHKHSPKTWNGMGADPWPHTTATTVAANACENCHRPHTAGGGPRLLNHAAEESNCLACHNGNVAAKNIQAEFSKAYAHDIGTYTGIHTPSEPGSVATSHVECVDCHNPHAVNATLGSTPAVTTSPTIPGSLAGVRGIHIGGSPVNPATAEYEICFRCHADGAGNTPAPRTARQIVQNNKRLEFQTSNPSYHPLAGAGRSTNVPSLLAPWSTSSRVKCTDCHNNNLGPYSSGTGTTPAGSGVNGAHGSTYPLLLERQYVTADYTSESATNYALCYKCHSRTSILSNATFGDHSKHIVEARTPCNVCHDPHGISSTQGTATNNARLINFDTSIVRPSGGVLRWTQTGTNRGSCTLICHGRNHSNWTY
ncbi:MAG: cytochrome c3 family protein [Rubrivivax sp.]|nr:cytochrome c3 family protein [Rubrivivax sp.]